MKKLLILLFIIITFTAAGCCTKDCPSGTHCENDSGLEPDTCVTDASSSSATTSSDPFIQQVSYSAGVLTIDLQKANTAATTVIKSRTTIRKGGFTGTQLSFSVTQNSTVQYVLDTLSPSAVSGQTYYVTFQTGAFYDSTDTSAGSVFAITIP